MITRIIRIIRIEIKRRDPIAAVTAFLRNVLITLAKLRIIVYL